MCDVPSSVCPAVFNLCDAYSPLSESKSVIESPSCCGWPRRLAARTRPFQGRGTGSIPVGVIRALSQSPFFSIFRFAGLKIGKNAQESVQDFSQFSAVEHPLSVGTCAKFCPFFDPSLAQKTSRRLCLFRLPFYFEYIFQC